MPLEEITPEQKEREALVAEWLIATPGFFDRQVDLLAKVQLKNPHGEKAISLQEKQLTLLRNQNRDLNRRLSDMLRFGAENDKTQHLMVGWITDLLAAKDFPQTLEIVTQGLDSIFEVGEAKFISTVDLTHTVLEALRAKPYCGSIAALDTELKAHTTRQEGSTAVLLLSDTGRDLGVLMLASPLENRFTNDMGLQYLNQLCQLASSALGRFYRAV